MTTDKTVIQYLAAICASREVTTVIISPGSRNAPLTIAFNRQAGIECISVVDERSAAFFALGIAQQTGKTVALICTSGTASLNYAPAIAEAYYQEIPLLILTADRPTNWIDKGESQVIRQNNIYANFSDRSFNLLDDSEDQSIINTNINIINEALDSTKSLQRGPVHINIPLEEPLYNFSDFKDFEIPKQKILEPVKKTFKELENWKNLPKKLILTGLLEPNAKLNNILNKISEDDDVVVLTETNSNLNGEKFISSIDKVLSGISESEKDNFKPDLLITIGHNVISKMVKSFIRENRPTEHWHIDATGKKLDTYDCLSSSVKTDPVDFLNEALKIQESGSGFYKLWKAKKSEAQVKHDKYLSEVVYSDIKVFDIILKNLPNHSILQMGNSTVVRYIQLFDKNNTIEYYSNRGTSGIDGCTSTAAGAAYADKSKKVTLITGDISFLYDSNALWNKNLPDNLKIIIINNSGGGIFRFLKGSSEIDEMEKFFETGHNVNLQKISEAYGISFTSCYEPMRIEGCLEELFASKKVSILEIKTPSVDSAESLKKYFNFIK